MPFSSWTLVDRRRDRTVELRTIAPGCTTDFPWSARRGVGIRENLVKFHSVDVQSTTESPESGESLHRLHCAPSWPSREWPRFLNVSLVLQLLQRFSDS